ncbi:bone marrow stromal antigen 2 isoform X2 [Fukomys damarensis]|uniref:bone marrow stromal antigen 2 isoform X2 n=1 Tax=Fukomys damarensis TaxID=885580 RepID=UPI0005400B66|nr:bone marrow stromal antigen 2 isoform X2 [Fukomys damarensis]
MDDVWRGKNGRDCRLLQPAVLGVLLAVIVVLAVTLGYSGTKTCDACEDGLRAEARCHNITDHLQDRLTRAQKTLQDARALCDSTVENLNAALAEMKTQEEQQRKQVQDLKNEIEDLKQKLQRAEEEAQLLRDKMASSQRGPQNAAGQGHIPLGLLLTALLGLAMPRP